MLEVSGDFNSRNSSAKSYKILSNFFFSPKMVTGKNFKELFLHSVKNLILFDNATLLVGHRMHLLCKLERENKLCQITLQIKLSIELHHSEIIWHLW
jgi:hypothetical protein